MKLKILPPHLRNKKRYLAFEVISETSINRDDVISIIWGALWDMYGSCGISRFDLWVIKIWNYDTPEKHVMKGILRCKREEVHSVRSIIPTITRFKSGRVVFHTLGISGSIHSATKKFIYNKL